MCKNVLTGIVCLVTLLFIITGCKKDNVNAITPTYASASPGVGGNPQPNMPNFVPTPTAAPLIATNNSYMTLGSTGWANLSCSSTNSLVLKSTLGNTEVVLQFASPPAIGTYTYFVVSVPSAMGCSIYVREAPQQPSGIIWYGYSGSVAVTTNTNGIYAVLQGPVRCRPSGYLFPVVTLDGTMGCQN